MPKDAYTRQQHRSTSHRDHSQQARQGLASLGVELISSDDYFLKSDNFRLWLKQYKGKYFDELSGEKARHYFDKFVKAWNRSELSSEIYDPPPSSRRAAAQTGYKWSFASKLGIAEDQKRTSADAKALEAARESVASATASTGAGEPSGSGAGRDHNSSRRAVPIGPSLPPGLGSALSASSPHTGIQNEADRQYAREEQADRLALSRATRHPIDKSDGEVYFGKEKQLENKRLKREENKAFREAKETGGGGGMDDVREDVLLGGGGKDSFAAAVAARDAARARAATRREEKRNAASTSATGQGTSERRQAILDKDRQTMEMFKAMAKERFG